MGQLDVGASVGRRAERHTADRSATALGVRAAGWTPTVGADPTRRGRQGDHDRVSGHQEGGRKRWTLSLAPPLAQSDVSAGEKSPRFVTPRIFLFITAIPDYLALWKSRVLLRWSCRVRSPLLAIIAPLLDILLSFSIIIPVLVRGASMMNGEERIVPKILGVRPRPQQTRCRRPGWRGPGKPPVAARTLVGVIHRLRAYSCGGRYELLWEARSRPNMNFQ
jgi:hypothetical protein